METQIYEEGEVELEVPRLEDYRTSPKEYVPSQTPVFFNPVMEFSRDISVSSLQVMAKEFEGLRVCDALAGVGARGIRYAKEVDGAAEVLINDRSSKAVDLIRKNLDLNDLSNVEVNEGDANTLFHNHRSRFHAIDLDPFGSPVPFLDSSFYAVSRPGVLLITATDTAPLCGAYPKVCLRRYGGRSLRTPYSRELGLRILIGSVQRRAAAFDLALAPFLSHATQHYFRIHFRVSRGAKSANKIIEKQGYVSHCFGCGRRLETKGLLSDMPNECECGREFEHAGPMWLGELAERKHLQEVVEDLSTRDFELGEKERKLMRLCAKEAEGPPAFYDVHEVSSQVGTSPPKLDRVISELKKQGYSASRTHFSGTGLRTEAPMDALVEIISK